MFVTPPSAKYTAVGDGCADDTLALQEALDAMIRSGDSVSVSACGETGQSRGKWGPYYAGVYLPAGIYRIDGRLRIPQTQNFRIFGDGGRGGGTNGDVPQGTLIRQDRPDEPILVFDRKDTHSWAIERIGFTWKTQQGPAPGWAPPSDERQLFSKGVTGPGAVGILFSGVPNADRSDYYFGRIRDCTFKRGWRAVSFDDSYRDGSMALWRTSMEGLVIQNMRGAGISLVAAEGGQGMPVNSIRDTFIDNSKTENVESQIRIAQQGNFTMENVTLEHSKTRVLACTDCTMTMRNVSMEHVAIRKRFGKMVYFGGGHYIVDTFSFDGFMDGRNPSENEVGFTTVINAEGSPPNPSSDFSIGNPTTVKVSGVRAYPLRTTAKDPDEGGFVPLAETAVLFAGDSNTSYHLLDAPNIPVYSQARRTTEWDESLAPDGRTKAEAFGLYKELFTFVEGFGGNMSAVVRMPDVKATRTVFGDDALATPGRTYTQRVPLGDPPPGRPRARRGDAVRLGPPSNFPEGLTATGVVVADNSVDIRVFNGTNRNVPIPEGTWTILVGGGPRSGAPQILADPATGPQPTQPVASS